MCIKNSKSSKNSKNSKNSPIVLFSLSSPSSLDMPIKILKPTSPGRRKMSVASFDDITKTNPEKSLVIRLPRHAGRNAQGHITVRHRSGGAKKFYRMIDMRQDKYDAEGTIVSVEYDPYRSARIALVRYADEEKRYIVAPLGIVPGNKVLSSLNKIAPKIGYRMPLKFIPIGQPIFNIEIVPRATGILVRSAGNSATLLATEGGFSQVRLPSGEVRKILEDCSATIGQISNMDHHLVRFGKAGRMRHRGIRPTVRGKAMNPVDHPHGGGEGHNPIGMTHPKTPWGKHAFGVKTRKKGKWSDALILKRRK